MGAVNAPPPPLLPLLLLLQYAATADGDMCWARSSAVNPRGNDTCVCTFSLRPEAAHRVRLKCTTSDAGSRCSNTRLVASRLPPHVSHAYASSPASTSGDVRRTRQDCREGGAAPVLAALVAAVAEAAAVVVADFEAAAAVAAAGVAELDADVTFAADFRTRDFGADGPTFVGSEARAVAATAAAAGAIVAALRLRAAPLCPAVEAPVDVTAAAPAVDDTLVEERGAVDAVDEVLRARADGRAAGVDATPAAPTAAVDLVGLPLPLTVAAVPPPPLL